MGRQKFGMETYGTKILFNGKKSINWNFILCFTKNFFRIWTFQISVQIIVRFHVMNSILLSLCENLSRSFRNIGLSALSWSPKDTNVVEAICRTCWNSRASCRTRSRWLEIWRIRGGSSADSLAARLRWTGVAETNSNGTRTIAPEIESWGSVPVSGIVSNSGCWTFSSAATSPVLWWAAVRIRFCPRFCETV